jgi:hypothetical protein
VGGGFGVAGSGILAKVAGAESAPGRVRAFSFGGTFGAGRAWGSHLVAFERPGGAGRSRGAGPALCSDALGRDRARSLGGRGLKLRV